MVKRQEARQGVFPAQCRDQIQGYQAPDFIENQNGKSLMGSPKKCFNIEHLTTDKSPHTTPPDASSSSRPAASKTPSLVYWLLTSLRGLPARSRCASSLRRRVKSVLWRP